ncbi:MAG TPA: hypothetical protein VF522_24470 [Ramlibacter sp.]|uniref:hypothetical protein n=1 Tax=Ramlibacter sp. TaxID=1917967 RepID=UPI002ED324D7
MRKPVNYLFVATAALGGCALPMGPQSRADFVQEMKAGTSITGIDGHIAPRRFDQVVGALQRKADECLNLKKRREEVHTALKMVGSGRAELTMQVAGASAPLLRKVPRGGAYVLAVDIEHVSPSMTRLTYYGPGIEAGQQDWVAIKEWSDGQAAPCPVS